MKFLHYKFIYLYQFIRLKILLRLVHLPKIHTRTSKVSFSKSVGISPADECLPKLFSQVIARALKERELLTLKAEYKIQ